jgi:hypothetical protein
MSLVALVACNCAMAEGGGHQPAGSRDAAISEADFLDSFGVNVHLNYTDGAYARLDRVQDDMRYLGIVHMRTHDGGSVVPIDSYARLAGAGLRFNLIATADRIDETVSFAARLMAKAPRSVSGIEGFNEINNWPFAYRGLKGEDAARAAQADLYARVKARPELRDVPVLYFTGGQKTDDVAGMADITNFHAYNNNALQPRPFILNAIGEFGGKAGQLPRANTEFGNFTLPDGWPEGKPYWANYTQLGVDEPTQAKIVLNAFFEGVRLGVGRSYVYELLDQKPDPAGTEPEMHFGLFTFDNRPKASATALHNLTAFLERTRGKVASASVDASLSRTDDAIGSIAIRRKDGSLIVALWNRDEFWRWDQFSSGPTSPAPRTVRLTARSKAGEIAASAFDPLADTVRPLSVGEGGTIDVSVPNYPVLVLLAPGGSS